MVCDDGGSVVGLFVFHVLVLVVVLVVVLVLVLAFAVIVFRFFQPRASLFVDHCYRRLFRHRRLLYAVDSPAAPVVSCYNTVDLR